MTEFVDVPGGRIACDVTGSGPLVVLSHGIGDCRQAYRFLAPMLAQAGYRVANADLTRRSSSEPDVSRLGQARLLPDHRGGPAWRVFPFAFETSSTRTRLNWEHDRYCWTRLPLPAHRPSVPQLPHVNWPADRVFSQPPTNALQSHDDARSPAITHDRAMQESGVRSA
jgi:hypothetical protein